MYIILSAAATASETCYIAQNERHVILHYTPLVLYMYVSHRVYGSVAESCICKTAFPICIFINVSFMLRYILVRSFNTRVLYAMHAIAILQKFFALTIFRGFNYCDIYIYT